MKIAAARQALVTAALLALPATGAAQSVQWYQYSVSTRYGDARFLAPIASCVASGGRCIEVERDLRRRLTRVTSYRDGKKVSEVHYSYSPGDTLPNAYEVVSANGTITEKDRLRRNARGQRISDSSFTVAGALTDYELRTYTDTSGEERDYSADGKETARYSYYYTGDVLTRSVWYANDSTTYESAIDPSTGLWQSRRKIVSDKVQASDKYTYAPDGTLLRDDIYDGDGTWYGMREYAEGLEQREYYKFTDSTEQETRYTYDERRWTKEASFKHNGTLICTFMYDRFPDGTIKRTLALGPNGELLAEYPDKVVDKVMRDGTPIDGGNATIYKKGDWW